MNKTGGAIGENTKQPANYKDYSNDIKDGSHKGVFKMMECLLKGAQINKIGYFIIIRFQVAPGSITGKQYNLPQTC